MWVGCHRSSGLLLALAVLLSTAGCSASGSDEHARGVRSVRVVERDFHIKAPKRVSAGKLDLSIRNAGPADHELIVVRPRGHRLPLRKDGFTVDEDAVEKDTVGALEPAPTGVHRLRVRLEPGRYELLCNMSGHYMGGMRARLLVTS
jgi:uncharacterized cupredoxin-like copper-binding protein